MREDEQTAHIADDGGAAITLSYVLGVLRQSAWLIVAIVAAATLATIAVVVQLPNSYDAFAAVQIDPRRKSISNMEGVVSELKADQSTVESEVELLRSTGVILKVIELLDLRRDPEFVATGFPMRLSQRLRGIFGGSEPTGKAEAPPAARPDASLARAGATKMETPGEFDRDEVLMAFAGRLRVVRVRNTTLIEIRFTSVDPVKAMRIANALAEVYVKDQIEEKFRASTYATGLLEEKLGDMRRRVSEAERRIEQFKAENDIFDIEGQILSERQLSRLMEQTVLARNATTEVKAKYEQARRMIARGGSKGEIANVLQSHTISLLKDELARLTRREAELMTRYGERHPEMLKVRAEIADASHQLNAEIDRLVANLKNEYEVAEDREQQLATSLGAAKEQQIQTKDAAVKLMELQRDASTSKQLFEALLARYKQTAETQDMHLADARFVERATVPLEPAAPKRKMIVLIGFGGALGFALAVAFLIDMLAPGLARAEDVRRALEHDHLASVPKVDGSREPLRSVRLMVADPHGTFAEAVRGLRHELDAGQPSGAPRVIMMASGMPHEGKSAIASNLAHHLALTGVRTLLVDADLRKASLTHILCPAGASIGARDCLEDRCPVEEAILRDQVTGLCFLPAQGQSRPRLNASELLVSPAMTSMIGRLRELFDVIIIDGPPLLPVVDARILADFADQIVFIMSWRKTPKELARRALRNLGINERKVVGIVLNQVDERELIEAGGYDQAYPRLDGGALRQAA